MEEPTVCECGCGRSVLPPRRWIRGHAGLAKIRKEWSPEWYTVTEMGYATPCHVWNGATKDGYAITRWNGKTIAAHIRAWVESGRELVVGLQLDHLCRVRACVNVDHLEQVTRAENVRRSARTKLTWALVTEIRERYAAGGVSQPTLAREYDVSQGNISSILLGHTWKVGT